jgi:hypothetical protein
MRLLVFLFSASLAFSAGAQTDRPPELVPIPEPPPLPPGTVDGPGEPQVTIIQRGEDVVEEYRIQGKLYMVKVTPPHGVPYYLVDHRGDGVMTRQDSLDSGLRVPMWVIHSF